MIKHGNATRGGWSREYRAWMDMRGRCYRPTTKRFAEYGGRGITVCDRWNSDFRSFLADMGTCPPEHSLDRENTNGNYEPGNCKWSTALEQNNNARFNVFLVIDGRTQSIAAWSRELGVSHRFARKRIRERGWSPQRALGLPNETPVEILKGHDYFADVDKNERIRKGRGA